MLQMKKILRHATTFPTMTSTKSNLSPSPPPPPPAPCESHHYYNPLPPQPEESPPLPRRRNGIVLSNYLPSDSCVGRAIMWIILLILISALVYVFWPSDPEIGIQRLRLNHVRIHTKPRVLIDLSLFLTVNVRNADVYSMDYETVNVAVGYKGKEMGHVTSEGGHVRRFGSSTVDAMVEVDGVELSEVVFLLEDLRRGTVSFDTVTEIKGRLGLVLFGFPLKAKVSCEVLLNTRTQTIIRQHCFPIR